MAADMPVQRVIVVVTPMAVSIVSADGAWPPRHQRLEHFQAKSDPVPADGWNLEEVAGATIAEAMSRARENGRHPLRLTYHVEFQLV